MNRQEFLRQLGERLQAMEERERAEVLGYFDELIQDKAQDSERPEEEVILDLGPLDELARTVMEGSERRAEAAPAAEDREGTEGPTTITTEVKAAQVRELVIRSYDLPILISRGAEDSIVLKYPDSEELRFDLNLNEGRLELLQQRLYVFRFFRVDWWFGQTLPREIVLQLPRDYAGSLDAETSNGRIQLSGVDIWGSLNLKTSNGRIELTQGGARSADAKTSNGRIQAEGFSTREKLSLTTSNGRITAEQVTSMGPLSLVSSNGSLRFSGLEGKEIRLKTSNSGIDGSVKGSPEDYSVSSSTSNGKNSLKDHAGRGDRRLEAHTSNGSIHIRFEG